MFLGKQVKKKVVLHIGLHKTGTSAIQLALSDNRRLLKKFDILYPQAGTHYYWGQHNLAWEILSNPMYDANETGWKEFFEEVEAFNGSTVVLSAEAFSTFSLEHIEAISNRLKDFDVEILLYLRGQIEWLQSFWCELAKGRQNAVEVPDLESWVLDKISSSDRSLDLPAGKSLGDFSLLIERWSKFFPADSITVKSFEKSIKHDLVKDFLVGLGVNDFSEFILPDRVNDKVDIKKLNLIRRSRSLLRKQGVSEDRIEWLKRFLMNYDGLNQSENGIYLKECTVDAIIEAFQEGNRQVNNQYFGGEELLPVVKQKTKISQVDDYTADEVSELISQLFTQEHRHGAESDKSPVKRFLSKILKC